MARFGRWALIAPLMSLAACGGGSEPPIENVVVIVVDTLGAGHLGAYGSETRSAHFDRLAEGGVRFEQAYSTAPWTKPSIASLFTGVMPSTHGVQKLADKLGEELLTLAELAREGGFHTHAVVSHFLITPEHGYGQGFAGFDGGAIAGHDGISSRNVTDRALAFLGEHASQPDSRRFFLFVHYFDPHFTYHHHPRFSHTAPYDGPVRSGMEIWGLRDLRPELETRDVDHLKGLYREEIAFTDHHIGRLLAGLARNGLDGDTLVVFSSDHGEELMEHGWIGHTRTLYDELIRVPLVFSLPGTLDARVVSEPVSILDVAPTIAQLCGLPYHPRWEGLSLAPLLRDGEAVHLDRPVFAEVAFGSDRSERRNERAGEKFARKTAVVLNDFKLIHDEPSGSYELYDRSGEGIEERNLWRDDMSASHPLYTTLKVWEDGRGSGVTAEDSAFDEAQLEELRQLGYVR